jgi:hypothetical protein
MSPNIGVCRNSAENWPRLTNKKTIGKIAAKVAREVVWD